MFNRRKYLALNIIQVDIISIIAFIVSICGIIIYAKCNISDGIKLLIFIASLILSLSSGAYLITMLIARITYKISEKDKIPKQYYFRKDTDNLQYAIILVVMTIFVIFLMFLL